MLRARKRCRKPDKKFIETYSRHRWQVEGMHGEAKTQHGLSRAVRRGLANVAIQAYLTAEVINLKRLAAFLFHFFTGLGNRNSHRSGFGLTRLISICSLLRWQKYLMIWRFAGSGKIVWFFQQPPDTFNSLSPLLAWIVRQAGASNKRNLWISP